MSAVDEVELLCQDFDKSMPFVAGKIRAAIGSLKCCGNCANMEPSSVMDEVGFNCLQFWDNPQFEDVDSMVELNEHCQFRVSRWKEL